jgi:hypothetical protein
MERRVCQKCGTAWYSAAAEQDWKCAICGSVLPVSQTVATSEGLTKGMFQMALMGCSGPYRKEWPCFVSPEFPGLCLHPPEWTDGRLDRDHKEWDISQISTGVRVAGGCSCLDAAASIARKLAQEMERRGHSWEEPVEIIRPIAWEVIRAALDLKNVFEERGGAGNAEG